MERPRYQWVTLGDVNAFFGLMLDNVAGLILAVGLLDSIFGFPAQFAVEAMVPGTAIGVFVGDLMFFVLAFRLARRTGSTSVTAMPLGLDTPSTFGMVLFVLGPAFVSAKAGGMDETEAARFAWHIGIWSILFSGCFKIVCAPLSNWVRRNVPRAGLLGSLAAIALVLISFLPLLDILRTPLVGFVALTIVLTSLVGRVSMPLHLPGTLGALLVAGTMYYMLRWFGVDGYAADQQHSLNTTWMPTQWLEVFQFEWLGRFHAALQYLPVVLPFAIATVIGGIDCTESAASVGDEYSTKTVVFTEGFATLIAACCGGVVQTTPYIGHPAYKRMGGRSGYTLATAITMLAAGVGGGFAYFYQIIPAAAVYPVLIFIGLEITAQSFAATPRKHFPAVALACVPALAALAINFPNQIFANLNSNPEQISDAVLKEKINILLILSNGFILTSLLWASALAAIIDHRLRRAATFLLVCSGLTLFGVIHSPDPGSPLYLPHSEAALRVMQFALGYATSAAVLALWSCWIPASASQDHHQENQQHDEHEQHILDGHP